MNILVLTPLNPLKHEGGLQYRVWNFWKRMAEKHNVIIVACDASIFSIEERTVEKMRFVFLPLSSSPLRFIQSLIQGSAPPFFRFNTRLNFLEIQKLVNTHSFDLIACDHLWFAPTVLKLVADTRKIFLSHGLEFLMFERLKKIYSSWKRFVTLLLTRNLQKIELDEMRRFDAVTCLNEKEKKILIEYGFPSNSIEIIPNGIDLPLQTPQIILSIDAQPSLLFLGSMNYEPNHDAMMYFIKSIYQGVKKIHPHLFLNIIGTSPKKQLIRSSQRDSSIRIHGFVENLSPYFNSDTICIAPLRVGTGTRVKILEYWSRGMPVVSTSIGTEGLEGRDGVHLLVRDDPETFVSAIDDLIRHPEFRKKLGQEGRRLVETHYQWDTIVSHFDSFLQKKFKPVADS